MHATVLHMRRTLRQAAARTARCEVRQPPPARALRNLASVAASPAEVDGDGHVEPMKTRTSTQQFNLLGAATPEPRALGQGGKDASMARRLQGNGTDAQYLQHRRKNSGKWWQKMDRASFNKLLSEGFTSGKVSSVLRKYMDEYPILDNNWTDQELVMIVNALIKMNRSEIALDVLRNQVQEPNRNRLNRVAAMSARVGNAKVALGVLEITKHFEMEPDVITYTSAIHACARGGRYDLPTALHLLNEMISAGVTPNARTYGAAVLAYARMQRWEEIQELMDSIPYTDEAHKADVFTSAIITCSRNRQYAYSTRLFELLLEDGVYPGDHLCNAALSACARTTDLQQLHRIFQLIKKHAKPTVYAFNCMLSAFGNARKMEKALQVFKSMQAEHDVTPDAVTFNALLLGSVRARKLELVPFILSLMSDAGAKWDVYTLNMLLEGCALDGDVEKAEHYWKQATQSKKDAQELLTNELQAVPSKDDVEEISTEEVQDVRLDRTHFETLMSVYYAAQDYAAIVRLWQDNCLCRRRAKSAKTLNFLIRACKELKDDATAVALMDELAQRGQPVSSVTHNHMISVYLAADKYPEALEYLKTMLESDGLVSTFSFTMLMKYLMKKERYADVLSMLDLYAETRDTSTKWRNPLMHYPADAIYVLGVRAAMAMKDHETVLGIYGDLPTALSMAVKAELLSVAVASCDREGDWRAAVTLYDEITAKLDEDTNVELYKQIVGMVARAGEFDAALDVGGGSWYRQNRPDQGWGI